MYRANLRKTQVYNNRNKRKTVLFTIGSLISIYLLLTMIFGEDTLLKYFKLRTTTANLKVEIDKMKRQNEAIRAEAELLKDGKDLTLIEKHARGFGLVKKGEMIYKFVDKKPKTSDQKDAGVGQKLDEASGDGR